MNQSVINTVFDFVTTREKGAVRTFKLPTLRNYVVRQGLIVGNATITRALRQLRGEGAIRYTFDKNIASYRVQTLWNEQTPTDVAAA